MASESVIFVLQADKVPPVPKRKKIKGHAGLDISISKKNTDSIENTGHCLKFAATRRT